MASGKEINVIDKCKRKKFSASARNLYCDNIKKKLKYVCAGRDHTFYPAN